MIVLDIIGAAVGVCALLGIVCFTGYWAMREAKAHIVESKAKAALCDTLTALLLLEVDVDEIL